MRLSETTLFLKEMLCNPRQIGALMPSSNRLAGTMANCLPGDPDAYVIELGPGTGRVTQALLDSGLNPGRLVAIEKSERLAEHLRTRFPRICILTGDAFELESITRDQLQPARPVDAVISSLPLRNFGAARVHEFCRAVSAVLRPGGVMVQYSYYIHQVQLHGLEHLQREQSQIVWKNLPPARVYLYRNQPAKQELRLESAGESALNLADVRQVHEP